MLTKNTAATIETAKGTHKGTIESCVAWQREQQAAFATLVVAGESYDVSGVDFGVNGDLDAVLGIVREAK